MAIHGARLAADPRGCFNDWGSCLGRATSRLTPPLPATSQLGPASCQDTTNWNSPPRASLPLKLTTSPCPPLALLLDCAARRTHRSADGRRQAPSYRPTIRDPHLTVSPTPSLVLEVHSGSPHSRLLPRRTENKSSQKSSIIYCD